jgi:hypothetical protein
MRAACVGTGVISSEDGPLIPLSHMADITNPSVTVVQRPEAPSESSA